MVDFAKLNQERKIKQGEKDRMKQKAINEGKATFDPTAGEKKPVPHITEYPDLVDCLPELAQRQREINELLKPLEKEKEENADLIRILLDAANIKSGSVRGDDWMVVRGSDTETYSLNTEKLLQKGVSWQILNECTDKTPKKGAIQVRKWEPKKNT